MAVRRYDLGSYSKPTKTAEGYLNVDATLTRTGVFKYRQQDGTVRRELRLPEEVFAPPSLASFALKPVTDEHPGVPVDATNVREFQRGTIAETPHQDGSLMRAKLLITDAELIKKLESKQKEQLSNGYDCDLEFTSGVYDGEEYDAIQRNIRGNHVAAVKRGRAGSDVRVHLDSSDAEQIDPETKELTVKKKIDGVEYEVSDQVAQAIDQMAKKHADAMEDQVEKHTADLKEHKDKIDDLTKKTDELTARSDAAEAKAKKIADAHKDAADPKRIDALVDSRLELRDAARDVLGDDFKTDGVADDAIRVEVLKTLQPELKLEGRSADYIAARFDSEVQHFRASSSGIHDLGRVARTDGEDPELPNPKLRVAPRRPTSVEDALAKQKADFESKTEEAWKMPLTQREARRRNAK